MQRTISAMVGKGSVNHNSRKFKAENVNADRSHLNIDYCNENIKKVYHELFDVNFIASTRYTFKVKANAKRGAGFTLSHKERYQDGTPHYRDGTQGSGEEPHQ